MAGNHIYAQLCRFFTPEVLDTMDRTGYDSDLAVSDGQETDIPSLDIKDRIRGMWD